MNARTEPACLVLPVHPRRTTQPLPGVTVGDIGPKYGTHTNDNGFLRLDRVRIPRDQMLMRFAKVSREGRYSTPPHAKLAYGTMVVVRATIIAGASSALAAATTIATRYSVVRQQGFQGDSKRENTILDYRTQQYRIFPLIAAAYALHFTGSSCVVRANAALAAG